MERLVKKIKITRDIELVTGLHIGGSSENLEIGGVDSPVIKLAFDNDKPYIPGSSLRGKIRCLLEQSKGCTDIGNHDDVNILFGIIKKNNKDSKSANTDNIPSRLIVRDAYITGNSLKRLEKCENLDLPYTEVKFENSINRLKGTADNPRQIERVPAGVHFTAEFILNIWDTDDEKKLIRLLKDGFALLENDYLGGSGSRGYGQIRLGDIKAEMAYEGNGWTMYPYAID